MSALGVVVVVIGTVGVVVFIGGWTVGVVTSVSVMLRGTCPNTTLLCEKSR